MKQISPELAEHIAGEELTLATCWKITRKDSVVLGFTDHDINLVIDGITYSAASGYTPSAITDTSGLNVDNLTLEGMLSAASIKEEDIAAGKYDFAEIEIFRVNYADVSQGRLKLRKGWFGEVTCHGSRFQVEIRGLAQRLSQTIGELYSPSCRASLGDSRCKVNMASHSFTGSVTATASRQQFQDTSRTEPAGVFAAGKVTFTSGANAGLSMEIKEHSYTATQGGSFTLCLPMPHALQVGDAYSITKGCDKTLATCRTRFNNVLNFRGEPHVPGLDRMLETASTRSVI